MLPLTILVILTLFTWAVAIWATMEEEQDNPPHNEKKEGEEQNPAEQSSDWRNAA